jgi:hypothetical protein
MTEMLIECQYGRKDKHNKKNTVKSYYSFDGIACRN